MEINLRSLPFTEDKRSNTRWIISGMLSLLLLFLCFVPARAQEYDTLDVSLNSPYQAVYTHLSYLQDNNYKPEIAAQPFLQEGVSLNQAREAAIKLKQILDGQGIYLNIDEIPNKPDYLDSASNRHRYVLTSEYPDIYLSKQDGKWIFSRSSISRIMDLHEEVFPLGTDQLLKVLPRFGDSQFVGLYVWQLLGILIIIVLSFVVHILFTFLFEKIIIALLNRYGYKEVAHSLIKPIAKPISYLVIVPILMVLVPVLQLPVTLGRYVIIGLDILWPVFLTVVFYRLVDVFGIYMLKVAHRTESTLDDQLVPLLRKIFKTFVIIIGVLYVLINLDLNIIPFLTGLSIGGLAFALAAQDTLKNFFGSLMIFVDRPFQVGHWITSGDIDGEVEEVGLRSTRVRTFRNSLIYVPNAMLADRMIDNHGLRVYRRFFTTVAITYDTPPGLIEVFIEGLNKLVENHPHTRKDKYHIFLNDFGDSSLNIMFYIFFEAPSWALELQYRHEIMISIVEMAEELNVRFAFPTRSLHMETFPDKSSLTPVYGEDQKAFQKKMNEFIEDKKKKLRK